MRLRARILISLVLTALIIGGLLYSLYRLFLDPNINNELRPEWMIITALAAGILVIFILWFHLQRVIIKPIHKIIQQARIIRESKNLSIRLGLQRKDEIGMLGEEFDHMIEQLQEIYGGMTMELHKHASELTHTVSSLRRNQEFLRQLFANSPMGIARLDADNRIIAVNDAFATMFQHNEEDIKGISIDELLVPDEFREEGETLSARTFQGETIYRETARKRKDATLVDVIIHGIPIYLDRERIGIYGIYIDVSDLKRAQDEKLQLTDQLMEAKKMEAVGTLAGGMAHEFNNLMAIILGNTDMFLTGTIEDPDLSRRFKSIREAAERASTLTNQLLSFSRNQLLRMETIDITDLLSSLGYMMRNIYGEKIKKELKLNPGLHSVQGDQSSLTQVMMDIIQNASDAMEGSGKITINAENAIFEEADRRNSPDCQPGSFVCVSITDTGCGMDEETRKHVFEPFFTTKRVKNATGLGLAFVYGTIKQHGGWLDVTSKVGQGTTFKIYLPTVT